MGGSSMDQRTKGNKSTVVDLIRRFVTDDVGPYEWDDTMGVPWSEATIEKARLECEAILRDLEKGAVDGSTADARLLATAEWLERSGD